jgi:hypothetical protein
LMRGDLNPHLLEAGCSLIPRWLRRGQCFAFAR